MLAKLRVGELLLRHEWIDPWVLSHALRGQASTRHRIVSLLVGRALLDPDDGAMVLSEQLGYPAALQRHLERRDPAVVKLVPPELCQRWVVLPIARARTGDLVVLARDPSPILLGALEHASGTKIVLAVTPSIQLDRLVRSTFGIAGEPEEPLPQSPPSLADLGAMPFEDTPLPLGQPRTVSYMFDGAPELPVRATAQVSPIESVLQEIDRAITRVGVERHAMSYVSRRWQSALLLQIANGVAIGVRGHGAHLGAPGAISLALAPASIIKVAHDTQRATQTSPARAIQDRSAPLLGGARAAAPIVAEGRVEAVLVVGDPVAGTSFDTLGELERVVDALGAAYTRFAR